MEFKGLNEDGLRVFEHVDPEPRKPNFGKSKSQHQYTNREPFHVKDIFFIMDTRPVGETHVILNGRKVEITNTRLETFRKNTACVECGANGVMFSLEKGGTKNEDHFNLYRRMKSNSRGLKQGQYVLMTQDHILPKSKGGSDELENLQTMCSPCNSRKSNKVELYVLRVSGYMCAIGGVNVIEKTLIGKPKDHHIETFLNECMSSNEQGMFYLHKNMKNKPLTIKDVEVIEMKRQHNKTWSLRK